MTFPLKSFVYPFVLFAQLTLFGQSYSEYNIASIGEDTEFIVLNSVSGTTFNLDKSNRISRTYKIPKYTDFVIVKIAVENENTQKALEQRQALFDELMNASLKPGIKVLGGTALLLSQPPRTGYYIDFFTFTNMDDYRAFTSEGSFVNWAYEPSELGRYLDYCRDNSQGKTFVIDVRGLKDKSRLYFGFKNNDRTNAVKISVDLFALSGDGWTEEYKEELQKEIKKELLGMEGASNEEYIEEISSCFIDKLTNDYSLDEFTKLPEYERVEYAENAMKSCVPEIEQEETKARKKANFYGELAWDEYENDSINKSIEYSLKALEIDDLNWVHSNLGLCYLIQGKNDKALDEYLICIEGYNASLNPVENFGESIDDLKKAMKSNSNLKYGQAILDMLIEEMSKF